MRRGGCGLIVLATFLMVGVVTQARLDAPEPTVGAVIETTLKTAEGQIRQFVYDGNPDTYFLSAQNVTATDHLTLVFDKPVKVQSIAVTTGRPAGGDALDAGVL